MLAALPGPKWSVVTIYLLLACGADVSLADNNGKQALHYAVGTGFQDVPKFIDSNEVVNPEWQEAVVPVITCLIEAGADIFALDNLGRTTLHYALSRDNLSPWIDALERCGLLVQDRMEESFRRRYQWKADLRRLHGAKRTAVDAEILQAPSTQVHHRRRRQISQPGDDDWLVGLNVPLELVSVPREAQQ